MTATLAFSELKMVCFHIGHSLELLEALQDFFSKISNPETFFSQEPFLSGYY